MQISNSNDYIKELMKSIEPSMRLKDTDDFDTWQKEARAKLGELLGMQYMLNCEDDFKILATTEKEEYTQYDFTYQSEPGYYVPCSMLVPKGVDKPIATAICLQGHSTGMHISLGMPKFERDPVSIAGGRDFAVRAVKEGYCAIAMEQRYMGVCGQEETGGPACAKGAARATILLGRTAIGERVWDIQRLIDVMEKHLTQYVDTNRIICMGNSGGGTATFYASCMEERIYLSMPSCSVCTFDDSIVAMIHCGCNYIPGIRRFFEMGDMGCLIAPRRLVVVCGVEDKIFPEPGVDKTYEIIQKAYKRVGKEALCHLVKGQGGHQFYPDDAWPVVKQIMD